MKSDDKRGKKGKRDRAGKAGRIDRADRIDRVEDALKAAWNEESRPEVSDLWQARVMSDIKAGKLDSRFDIDSEYDTEYSGSHAVDGSANGQIDALDFQGKLVWRFSAVAAAITIFMVIYAYTNDITSLNDLAAMLLDDPTNFILSQPFG
jgi:hypothetical protein